MPCRDCSTALSELEAAFYGDRCEVCEQAWSDRIGAWRRGETKEPELDAFYAGRAALAKAAPADAERSEVTASEGEVSPGNGSNLPLKDPS